MSRSTPLWLVLANHAAFMRDPRTTDEQRRAAERALSTFLAQAALAARAS